MNKRNRSNGSTPLSEAAFRGNLEIVGMLIDEGADVNGTNRDGNTPLLVAAFMCRTEVVEFLLDKGASTNLKNGKGETPLDVVSSDWSEELAGFYSGIANATGIKVDLDRIKNERPRIVQRLNE